MRKKPPTRDPIRAYQRDVVAGRRVPENAQCACGESRLRALIRGSDPVICARCDRLAKGRATLDSHHVAGQANSPVKIPISVNDHRARLSADQYEWPKETLENPNGSPLHAAAARIRGFDDVLYYLIENLQLGTPEVLEELDSFLVEQLGPEWWKGTPLEKYAPRR